MSEADRSISERLSQLIEESDYSVPELAEKISVAKGTIYNVIKGKKFNIDILIKLVEELDVSADYILFGNKYARDYLENELLKYFRQLNKEEKVDVISKMSGLLVKQEILKNCESLDFRSYYKDMTKGGN